MRLLSLFQVCVMLSVSKSTVYRLLASEGKNFPRPIRISVRRIAFWEGQIEDWVKRLC